MFPSATAERTVDLPGRPWVLGGHGQTCLVRLEGHTLVPVFRTATTAREYLARLGDDMPGHFYPQFPDATEFATLLATAVRNGAEGYVVVDDGCWQVICFAVRPRPPVPAAA